MWLRIQIWTKMTLNDPEWPRTVFRHFQHCMCFKISPISSIFVIKTWFSISLLDFSICVYPFRVTYQPINKIEFTSPSVSPRGVILVIRRIISTKPTEMAPSFHFQPPVNFLTFRRSSVKVEISSPLLFIIVYWKYIQKVVLKDHFHLGANFHVLRAFIDFHFDDVIGMTHDFWVF